MTHYPRGVEALTINHFQASSYWILYDIGKENMILLDISKYLLKKRALQAV